jgi:ABC-2 type transport system permease protein
MTYLSALVWRNLRKVSRSPQLVFFSLIQPVVFLLLFSQVFRSIQQTPGFPQGVSYVDYLVPAILITSLGTNSVQSGVGIAGDLLTGLMDRFRFMPIRSSAVLLARSLSDIVRSGVQTLVLLLVAVLFLGFRFHTGVAGVIGVFVIALLFGWALSWVYIAVGTATRNIEATQMAGFLITFPLMFASSAFVPSPTLPGWLQGFLVVNPFSQTIDASRALALGWPAWTQVLEALAAIVGLATIGIALALTAFRRKAA